jgi:WD40 repeat protein
LAALPPLRADDLPSDAVKRIKDFEAEAEAIQRKADAQINARHDKLIADLEGLKIRYTKAGELDAALAIRDRIRQLKMIKAGEEVGEVRRFEEQDGPVFGVAFSPDGRLAVCSTSEQATIRLWVVKTGKELLRLEGHAGSVWGVAFSPDGQRVLSCGDDRTVRLWNAQTGEEWKRLEGHDQGVFSAVFSPDGKQVLSGGVDRTVRLWDVASGKELKSWWDTRMSCGAWLFRQTAAGHFPAAGTKPCACGTSKAARRSRLWKAIPVR